MDKRRILCTCPKGLSSYLRDELAALGYEPEELQTSVVQVAGTMRDAYRLNLHLRTAHRVLYHIADFEAGTAGEMYDAVHALPWDEFIPAKSFLTVTGVVRNESIRDTSYANRKLKDAVVDRIRQKKGVRPDSGPGKSGVVVHLYWIGSDASVYIDTSGQSLHKRGYRRAHHEAPLQESLAAAIVAAMDWRPGEPLVNPMCGGGTIVTEAALIALNMAPGLLRQDFSFMHLNGFDKSAWSEMVADARAAILEKSPSRIIATDLSSGAVMMARKNAMAAGVDHAIEFKTCGFQDTPMPAPPGRIIMNPEYGVRMGAGKDLPELYGRIGDFLKKSCIGYTGFVFTCSRDLGKHIGLRTSRRVEFHNGDLECRLYEYRMFKGHLKSREP